MVVTALGTSTSCTDLPTDRHFTGQLYDDTGLHYYAARYYDDHLGHFISPDTLVPDATSVFDYNRFMYVRGRVLNANDPSGHYSNEEIMQHFGCDSWGCVESNFNEGGALEGSWGWLNVLQDAQDGDMVTSTMLASADGQLGSINSSLMGRIQRNATGRIGVNVDTYAGTDYQRHSVEGLVDSDAFAQFARQGDVGMYGSEHGSMYAHSSKAACYNDCVTKSLDALSTGSATVAAGCAYFAVAPCVGVAGTASTVFSLSGTAWTAHNMSQGKADLADVSVSGSTTYIGARVHPYAGPFVSAYQWWLDTRAQ